MLAKLQTKNTLIFNMKCERANMSPGSNTATQPLGRSGLDDLEHCIPVSGSLAMPVQECLPEFIKNKINIDIICEMIKITKFTISIMYVQFNNLKIKYVYKFSLAFLENCSS